MLFEKGATVVRPPHTNSWAGNRHRPLIGRVQLMSEPARVEYTFEMEKAHPATVTLHHADGGTAIVVNSTARPVRISIHEVPTTEHVQSCSSQARSALVHETSACVANGAWFKSSHSGAGQTECVEAAFFPGGIAVRDSQEPDQAVLAFSARAWGNFVAAVRRG